MLCHVGARTSTIKLGTAVVILHWDHPVRVAERAAIVNNLTEGRLLLGVGRGAGFREQILFDVPTDQDANTRKFEEEVAILQGLWSGEAFSFDGEFFKLPPLILAPPVEHDLQLLVGSASLRSTIWAAERNLPYMTITWPLTGMDTYREKVDAYNETMAKYGRDGTQVDNPHILYMYCGESDEEAAEVGYKYMTDFQYINEHHYEFGRPKSLQTNQSWLGQQREGLKSVDHLARYPVENHIFGGVETVIDRVRTFEEQLGLRYMVLNMGYGLMPHEKALASMRRFAKEVMPHFAGESAPAAVVG